MFLALLAGTGLRPGEAMGIEIGKHISADFPPLPRTTLLRKNRAPEDLIRFWLGHADETVTDGYSKLCCEAEPDKSTPPLRTDFAAALAKPRIVPFGISLGVSQMIVSPNEEQKEKKSGATQQRQHRPGGLDRLVRHQALVFWWYQMAVIQAVGCF